MKPAFPQALLLGAIVCAGAVPLAGQVALYAQPDTGAQVIGLVPNTSPVVENGRPVMDTDARDAGWHWTEYEGTFNGFVEADAVDKESGVASGTLVYLEPDADSPVLTVVAEGDDPEIVDAGEWVEIRFSKAIPAYFLPPAAAPVVLPEGEQPTVADTDPPPAEVRPAEGGTATASKRVFRAIEGTLERASGPFPLGSPPYPFRLETEEGRFLMHVDPSDMTASVAFDQYADRRVRLTGFVMRDDKNRLVLKVRNVRLR